jgi:hypothetical protein
MGLRYYDHISGEMRFKPRYMYFSVGLAIGCVLTLLADGLLRAI